MLEIKLDNNEEKEALDYWFTLVSDELKINPMHGDNMFKRLIPKISAMKDNIITIDKKDLHVLDELIIMTAGQWSLGPPEDPFNKLVHKWHTIVCKELNRDEMID